MAQPARDAAAAPSKSHRAVQRRARDGGAAEELECQRLETGGV